MNNVRNNKGITLMEVIVGIAVLMVVSLPLLQMFVTSTKVGRRSYDTDKANAVALATVEQVRSHAIPYTLDASGSYEQKDYYRYDWSAGDAANHEFSVITSVQGSLSGEISSAYIPQIVDASGNASSIQINYGAMPSSSYALTLTDNGSSYTLNCNYAILTYKGSTTGSVTVPKSQILSGIFPVVINDTENTTNAVSLAVNGAPGVEVGLYVFGDADGGLVSTNLLSGSASMSKLEAGIDTLKFDELIIHSQVLRDADGSVIADYVTKAHVAS